jgi:hypothetical protein
LQPGRDRGLGDVRRAQLPRQRLGQRTAELPDPSVAHQLTGEPDRDEDAGHQRDTGIEGDRRGVQRDVTPAQRPDRLTEKLADPAEKPHASCYPCTGGLTCRAGRWDAGGRA